MVGLDWTRTEALLDRAGDRLNPILVKEARQAMKSRQFVTTFSLLLICGWLWTVLFISFGYPAIKYAPVGPGVLLGYYLVLSVPLLIVVPYAAFRSLAAEREDGTYELLSITTLTSRQIVLGKLGSAILQMMVYYSALAPCIAFTYLLRGIDIITIGLLLAYTFLASLLLSALGLMMATVTRAKHWQVLLSVIFVMALLVFTFIWDSFFFGFFVNGGLMPIDQTDFWMANACLLSFYVPAVALCLFLAAGQITFASENRSTPIRVVLMAPQVLLAVWMIYYWLRAGQHGVLLFFVTIATIFWAIVGGFLSGELAELSARAKRQLPQSLLGRTLFTWFNPGSGTGYMFSLLNLLGIMVTAWIAAVAQVNSLGIWPNTTNWFCYTICLLGYTAGYLGIVRLAIVGLRRFTSVSLMAAFLFQLIAILCGILFPLLAQAMISRGDYSSFDYSYLQLPNISWTLYEVLKTSTVALEAAIFIGGFGALVFLANLVVAAREVEHVRQAPPTRVLEDERRLHRSPHPKKLNPWDSPPDVARP